MQILLSFLLLFTTDPQTAADSGAVAIVSKDSLSFRIPAYDANDVWKWNALPKGTFEYEWVFDIPVNERTSPPKNRIGHFAVIQESLGPPIVYGDLSELINNSKIYFWVTEEQPGEVSIIRKMDTFVKPTYENGVIKFTFHQPTWVESVTRYRPEVMTLRGCYADGKKYEEPVSVINLKDPREQKARSISGPFTADEYAIYQTVIDRALKEAKRYQPQLKIFIMNPSFCKDLFSNEENNLKVLKADDDTVADYLKKRTVESDLSSLEALGYFVLSTEAFYLTRGVGMDRDAMCGVRVSRIGFNSNRTQAIIYCGHFCVRGSSEGEGIFLKKLNDEWLIERRVTFFMS